MTTGLSTGGTLHVPTPVFTEAGVFSEAPPGCPQRVHHHRGRWLWAAELKHYKPDYRITTGTFQ